MLPEAKGEDLAYLSAPFSNNVYVFSLATGKVVGKLVGLDRPSGECVDRSGNIYITNTLGYDIFEYAHGGVSPIARLVDSRTPYSCSVDRKSGNLAVGDVSDHVSIYRKARGTPTTLTNGEMNYIYYDAYDDAGDLFVDGLYGNGQFRLAELPRQRKTFRTITIDQTTYPGSIYGDGKYLAVTDGYDENMIYRVQITGLDGTVVGKATLSAGKCFGGLNSDWIGNHMIVAPFRSRCGRIGLWRYPGGGDTIMRFGDVHEGFFGVAVSFAHGRLRTR